MRSSTYMHALLEPNCCFYYCRSTWEVKRKRKRRKGERVEKWCRSGRFWPAASAGTRRRNSDLLQRILQRPGFDFLEGRACNRLVAARIVRLTCRGMKLQLFPGQHGTAQSLSFAILLSLYVRFVALGWYFKSTDVSTSTFGVQSHKYHDL